MGKIIEFFQNLPRFFEIILVKPQFWIIALLVASAVTFVSVSKSQKAAQRAFVKKVKNIHAKQKAFNEEKNKNKLDKRSNQYNKAIDSLKNRIKYALWWNKKKIVITNPYLLDKSENANLAIAGNQKFTFMDVLNSVVEEKSKNSKQKTKVVTKNAVVDEIQFVAKKEVKPEPLNEKDKKELGETKKTLNQEKTVKQQSQTKEQTEKQTQQEKEDSMDCIYTDKQNDKTHEFVN